VAQLEFADQILSTRGFVRSIPFEVMHINLSRIGTIGPLAIGMGFVPPNVRVEKVVPSYFLGVSVPFEI
jgi:hypothetical protein